MSVSAPDWQQIIEQVVDTYEREPDAQPAPSIQWFPRQWLADVAVLSMSWPAKAMHHHLLMLAWQSSPPCSLPDDDLELRGWCQHPADWPDLWAQIRKGWRLHLGRWWQLGLCRTYLRQMEVRGQRRSAAERRWKGRDANASGSHSTETAPKGTTSAPVTPIHANASDGDASASKNPCGSDAKPMRNACASASTAFAFTQRDKVPTTTPLPPFTHSDSSMLPADPEPGAGPASPVPGGEQVSPGKVSKTPRAVRPEIPAELQAVPGFADAWNGRIKGLGRKRPTPSAEAVQLGVAVDCLRAHGPRYLLECVETACSWQAFPRERFVGRGPNGRRVGGQSGPDRRSQAARHAATGMSPELWEQICAEDTYGNLQIEQGLRDAD